MKKYIKQPQEKEMTYGLKFYLGTQLDIIKVRNIGAPYLWIYRKTFFTGEVQIL